MVQKFRTPEFERCCRLLYLSLRLRLLVFGKALKRGVWGAQYPSRFEVTRESTITSTAITVTSDGEFTVSCRRCWECWERWERNSLPYGASMPLAVSSTSLRQYAVFQGSSFETKCYICCCHLRAGATRCGSVHV